MELIQTTHRLLTVVEAAERLNIARWRAYAEIRAGRLPGVVKIGHTIRVDPDALERWIARGGHLELDPAEASTAVADLGANTPPSPSVVLARRWGRHMA